MRFSKADIPDEVVKAALSGNLLVLAGAGVSMQEPVRLPNFTKLAEEIAKAVDPANTVSRRAKIEGAVEGEGEGPSVRRLPPERYLQLLEDEKFDVKDACAEIIGEKTWDSTVCSDLHKYLIRVFASSASVRIVTTNFDLCFETAARELGWVDGIDYYSAPAVPLGREFSGIVHLHGDINKPQSQVLTASDYGAAYLRDGWAARFLAEAFSTYTVLMVGYSCNDVTVDYLTRALSAAGNLNAYSLDRHNSSDSWEWDWKSRGVNLIRVNDFKDLPELFEQLANITNSSARFCRERVSGIVARNSEPCDAELALLKLFLSEDAGHIRRLASINAWRESATSERWLKWLNDQDGLDSLFSDETDEASSLIREWAIDSFVSSGIESLKSILVNPPKGKSCSLSVQMLLANKLASGDFDDALIAFWLPLLGDLLRCQNGYLFLRRLYDASTSEELRLSLIEEYLLVNSPQENDRGPIRWIPSDNKIAEYIDGCTWSAASRLLSFCKVQLERAYVMAGICAKESVFFHLCRAVDPLDDGRDVNQEDRINLLLDVAFNVFTRFAPTGDASFSLASTWMESPCALVRRLGIEGARLSTADDWEKLSSVMKAGLVVDVACRHEVFRMLSQCYPKLSDERRMECIDYLDGAKWSDEIQRNAYGRFRVLSWLLRFQPEDEDICMRLAGIKKDYPSFREEDSPDYLYSTEVRFLDDSYPVDAMSLEFLRNEACGQEMFGETPWTIMVSNTVGNFPMAGYKILLANDVCYEDQVDLNVLSAVLNGLYWPELYKAVGVECLNVLTALLNYETFRRVLVNAAQSLALSPTVDFQSDECARMSRTIARLFSWGFEECSSQGSEAGADFIPSSIAHVLGRYAAEGVDSQEWSDCLASYVEELKPHLKEADRPCDLLRTAVFECLSGWTRFNRGFVEEDLLPLLGQNGSLFESSFDGFVQNGPAIQKEYWPIVRRDVRSNIADGRENGELERNRRFAYVVQVLQFEQDDEKADYLFSLMEINDDPLEQLFQGIRCWLHRLGDKERVEGWMAWTKGLLCHIRATGDRRNERVSGFLFELAEMYGSLLPDIAQVLSDGNSQVARGQAFFYLEDDAILCLLGVLTDAGRKARILKLLHEADPMDVRITNLIHRTLEMLSEEELSDHDVRDLMAF